MPEIPTKRNREAQQSVDCCFYVLRGRIECFINGSNSHRLAMRYDHTASSFLGFSLLGCIRLWIRFVQVTWQRVPDRLLVQAGADS